MTKEYFFPKRVDINPTARCNINPSCPFCFGPERSTKDILNTQNWFEIMDFFAENGTTEIVFTGGEPLVRDDIDSQLGHAKALGLRVTLSTNGILVPNHLQTIKNCVDDIGFSFDGSTKELNAKSRGGNINHFNIVLNAIDETRKASPSIDITVRTVVTTLNHRDLINIGEILLSKPINRWKVSGLSLPNWNNIKNWDTLKLSVEEFNEVTQDLTALFPTLKVDVQSIAQMLKGYVIVWPDGMITNLYADIPDTSTIKTDPQKLKEALGFVGSFQW